MKLSVQNMMRAKSAWSSFRRNHPQMIAFAKDVLNHGVKEASQMEITVRYPDGTELNSGIRLKKDDLDLFQILMDIFS